jgi:uncharacterized protein
LGPLKEFSLRFAGLEQGDHEFEFKANKRFFENFESSEISNANLTVLVEMQKHEKMLLLCFKLKGSVSLVCDRCLDLFEFELNTQNNLIVKIGEKQEEETDEIISISEHEAEINIAQFIYEYAHLSLPVKRVHPMDDSGNSACNKEIIAKLNKHIRSDAEAEKTDPRWETLSKLNFN